MREEEKSVTLKERVVRLETQYHFICEKLDKIQNNDLAHLDEKLDRIADKFNVLDKKVGEMAIKIGVVFALVTAIAETALKFFFK